MTSFPLYLLEFLPILGVLMARPLGFMAVFPLFVRAELSTLVKSTLALALSLPTLAYILQNRSEIPELTVTLVVFLSIKEAVVGSLIAFLLGIPFWSLQMVGEYSDSQRGISNSYIQDPALKSQASVTNEFLTILSISTFIAGGGFYIVTDTIYLSYNFWPAFNTEPKLNEAFFSYAVGSLDKLALYMMITSGPIVLLLLITDISFLFLGRLAPQLHVDQVSLVFKNIVFIIFIMMYVGFIVTYFNTEISSSRAAINILLRNNQ